LSHFKVVLAGASIFVASKEHTGKTTSGEIVKGIGLSIYQVLRAVFGESNL
jgi:hypothetical protein